MALKLDKPLLVLAAAMIWARGAMAQAPPQNLPPLTLQEAQAMAAQNHPQIQAAQDEINFAKQQIVVNRSAYYPNITGEVTGSQGNDLSRIGAGDLSASRLFDRFGQGVVVRQMVTDFGRTSNLVANARLLAQATEQTEQATRFDILLQVNRAYFDVLRAQSVVKVAQETLGARQLLSNQIGVLANNGLRSQLDVGFVDVNVSEAKLLLLRAQDAVQGALAELGRAMGSDQPANYQLAEEPLPAAPPASADTLVAQALNNRPELAGLKFSRDAAYKFAEAERDLSRPSVNVVAVGGYIPYINTPATAPIPPEYEGVAANLTVPLFNGHQYAARHEAATQRAKESDQRLRDQQQQISRDVRVAWAGAYDAFQRIDVTEQYQRQAALTLTLAQGRYDNGLSDIVALTQAQVNLTQAEIDNLNAKYDYQTQNAALQYALGLLR